MSKASRGVYYTHLPHIIHCVNRKPFSPAHPLFTLRTFCVPLGYTFLNGKLVTYDLCCLDSIMASKY